MAEDGIPEILAEQRLAHEVPGMRGVYAHVSERMRAESKDALQARWEDSVRARAAISPHSPVLLLDGLLAPFRDEAGTQTARPGPRLALARPAPAATAPPEEEAAVREKSISQIPPKRRKTSPCT